MPLKRGKGNIGKNIAEFHQGKTYAKTRAKFGKKVANKQAVAAAINASKKRKRS